MDCPSISVVVPAYNAEKTIAQTLQSIFTQTLQPLEIIVVDDGSTDGTIVEAKKFPGVVVVAQTNGGSSKARQAGATVATSDYIAYLDADDQWMPGVLERYSRYAKDHDIDFLFGDFIRKRGDEYLDENSTFFPWLQTYMFNAAKHVDVGPLMQLEPARARLLFLAGFPAFPSTYLVRRTVVLQTPWDERFRRSQDFDFALRVSATHRVHYLHNALTIVGIHEGNSDPAKYAVKQGQGDAAVLRAHLNESTDREYKKRVKKALAKKLFQVANAALHEKMYGTSLKFAGQAIVTGWNLKATAAYCLSVVRLRAPAF